MGRKRQTLGRAELELLQHISGNHPISVRQLTEFWTKRTGQARTTVLKMVERLMEKGFLVREKMDNVYHYSPRPNPSGAVVSVVADFVRNMLGGSVAPFVAYLTERDDLSAQEVDQLKKLVDQWEEPQADRAAGADDE